MTMRLIERLPKSLCEFVIVVATILFVVSIMGLLGDLVLWIGGQR